MKKCTFLYSLLILFSLIISVNNNGLKAQSGPTYGTQFENMKFEIWNNTSSNKIEPDDWHSVKSGTGVSIPILGSLVKLAPQLLYKSTEVRPGGTSGNCAEIRFNNTYNANGALVSGRMHLGDMSASDPKNYIYTDRGTDNGIYETPLELEYGIPDSITVWVCFRSTSTSNQAFIHTVIHGETNFKLLANGNYDPVNMLVAKAYHTFTRNCNTSGNMQWERKSVLFDPTGCAHNDAKYVLASFSTNYLGGVGTKDDKMYIDDVLLIYNPTLTVPELATTTYTRPVGGGELTINIPYTIVGTMSPYNLNKAANTVTAELSDANGSFDNNPTQLKVPITTDLSGTIEGKIPANIPDGTGYKVRVITTNYAMKDTCNSVITMNTAIPQYTLSLSAYPADGGTVSGGGTYSSGTIVTASASNKSGYSFVNWTENGNIVSTIAAYQFSLTSNRTLVANFQQDAATYTISATANPTNAGSISGAGNYTEGANVTLQATANSGFRFDRWTENGNTISGAGATYSFTASANRNLTAKFIATYDVSVTANPTAGGTVSGGATDIDSGTEITVHAVPATAQNYIFVNWTVDGGEVSTDNDYTFTVESTVNLVANFTQIAYYTINLTANPTTGGSVTGGGSKPGGEPITITALANSGYTFANWSEGGTPIPGANASYTFTVTGDRNLTANFTQDVNYTIAASTNPAGAGNINGTGSFPSGATVTLTASENSGYQFKNWTEDGEVVYSNKIYSFTANRDRTLVANYSHLCNINLTANPTEGGNPIGGGTDILSGTQRTIKAQPNNGYFFINWTKDGAVFSTEANHTFTVTESLNLKANYSQLLTVEVSANPTNGGTVSKSGTGQYQPNTSVKITAVPSANFKFVNWTEDGTIISTSQEYTFNITSNRTFVANFVPIYTITLIANPTAGGNVTGGGLHDGGSAAIVKAIPNSGYQFVNWTENGIPISGAGATYTFTVTGNRTLKANFESIPNYNISATASPAGAGTIEGTGSYQSNTQVILRATANQGYQFLNWTEDGTVVHSTSPYQFTATGNRTLVANFVKLFTLNVSASPTNGGTVVGVGITNGTGIFVNGNQISVTATANTPGFVFSNWTINGNVVGTNPSYQFNITANTDLVANFLPRHTVSIITNPVGAGTFSGNNTYTHGNTATVSVTPDEDHTFINWTKNGEIESTENPYSFPVLENTVLTANFQLIPTYTISATSLPAAGGTITGAGTYKENTNINLVATANQGYEFVNWTENGEEVTTSTTLPITVTANRTFVANFNNVSAGHDIILSANPENGGTVSGGGNILPGETATVIATAAENYEFINWTEDGTVVSTTASYQFTVEGERTLVANFNYIPINYNITLIANPTEGGEPSGGGSHVEGSQVTVNANTNSGYEFINWTEDGNQYSTDESYTFPANRNRTITANYVKVYSLTLTANPEEGGTVLGAGDDYHFGDEVTITAEPNDGYEFVNWMENGEIFSTEFSFTIEMEEDRTFVANFNELITYAVTLEVAPENTGTVTGDGDYPPNGEVTIEAISNDGYTFINWTDLDEEIISTDAIYTFNIEEDVHYIANFAASFTVTATVNPENSGQIIGTGDYTEGETVTLEAVAFTGFEFVNWTEDGTIVSTDAEFEFVINEDRDFIANFNEVITHVVTLSANPEEGGSVSGDGSYSDGADVTVLAVANEGYTFINWTEDGEEVSTEEGYSFVISEDKDLVANFEEVVQYNVTLSANPEEGGSVSGNGTYDSGTEVTVIATANTNYYFVNWTEDGDIVSTDATYDFEIESDRDLIANFEEVIECTISLTANPAEGGTVVGEGTYLAGSNVTIAATTNPNFKFINWTQDGEIISTDNVYEFMITEDMDIVANFGEIVQYNVMLTANPSEGGEVIGTGTYNEGANVTILAIANENYAFVNWTENGEVVATTTGHTFTISEDRNIVANFRTNYSYTVTLSANPAEGGTVAGSGNYVEGSAITIIAIPNNGYVFVNWMEDGNVIATTATHTITVNNNRNVVATFAVDTKRTITLSANPTEAGIVTGGGIFELGADANVTAIANQGYRFINWTENGDIVSTKDNYTFTVNNNRSLVANFEQIQYHTIIIFIENTNAGTVFGAGEYEVGTEVTLIAVPYTGYTFVGWYNNGEELSREPELTIIVEEDMAIHASFGYESIENHIIDNLKIYPNPAQNYVIIDSPYDVEIVEILSLSGKLIRTHNINADRFEINVSDLSTGTYIIKLKVDNTIVNKKVIISK